MPAPGRKTRQVVVEIGGGELLQRGLQRAGVCPAGASARRRSSEQTCHALRDVQHIQGFSQAERANGRPPVPQKFDDAFGGQTLQRFAHRVAAHAELIRQIGFDQPLAGNKGLIFEPPDDAQENGIRGAVRRIIG